MKTVMNPASACVALNLRRLSRVITRRYEKALKPLSLTSFQFSALVALSGYPTIPQSALADAFGMSVSTLNRNVGPLASRGVVEISESPKDRRVKLLSLTPAGEKLLAEAMPLWEQAQADALERLGADEWMSLKSKLDRILD